MLNVCTRDCKDRHVTCHVTCQKYIEAKADYEKYKKELKLAKEADDYIINMIVKTHIRAYKKQRG